MNAIEQAIKAMEAASFILGAYTPDRCNSELTAKWRARAIELDAAIEALATLSSPCACGELRAELQSQWESNHYEHCGNRLPCLKETCHWPRPKVLEETA